MAFVQFGQQIGTAASQITQSCLVPKPQQSGNTNLVLVNYPSGTITVASVTDTALNNYSAVVGPTRDSSSVSTSYMFASYGIQGAGSNTVSVSLSATVTFFSVFVCEYSGIIGPNGFDVSAGSGGNSAGPAATSVTTLGATDQAVMFAIAIGNNLVSGGNSAGSTQRFNLNNAYGVADYTTSSTGLQNVSWTLIATNSWIIQVAAMKLGQSYNPPQFMFPDSFGVRRIGVT